MDQESGSVHAEYSFRTQEEAEVSVCSSLKNTSTQNVIPMRSVAKLLRAKVDDTQEISTRATMMVETSRMC
jgi:hypothetical protein